MTSGREKAGPRSRETAEIPREVPRSPGSVRRVRIRWRRATSSALVRQRRVDRRAIHARSAARCPDAEITSRPRPATPESPRATAASSRGSRGRPAGGAGIVRAEDGGFDCACRRGAGVSLQLVAMQRPRQGEARGERRGPGPEPGVRRAASPRGRDRRHPRPGFLGVPSTAAHTRARILGRGTTGLTKVADRTAARGPLLVPLAPVARDRHHGDRSRVPGSRRSRRATSYRRFPGSPMSADHVGPVLGARSRPRGRCAPRRRFVAHTCGSRLIAASSLSSRSDR